MFEDTMDDELECRLLAWQEGFRNLSDFFLVDKGVNLTLDEQEEISSMKLKVDAMIPMQKPKHVLQSQNRCRKRSRKESKLMNAIKLDGHLDVAPGQKHQTQDQTVKSPCTPLLPGSQHNKKIEQDEFGQKNVNAVKSSDNILFSVKSRQQVSQREILKDSSARIDEKISVIFQSGTEPIGRNSQHEYARDNWKSDLSIEKNLKDTLSSRAVKYPTNISPNTDPKDSVSLIDAKISAILQSHAERVGTESRENVKYSTDVKKSSAKIISPNNEDLQVNLKDKNDYLNEAIDKMELLMKKLQVSETLISDRDQVIKALKEDLEKSTNHNRIVTCANKDLTSNVKSLETIIQTQESENLAKLNEHKRKIEDLNEKIEKLTGDKQEIIKAQESVTSTLDQQKSESESFGKEPCQKCSNIYVVHMETQTEPSLIVSSTNTSLSNLSIGRSIDEDNNRILNMVDHEKAKFSLQNNRSNVSFDSFKENLLVCAKLVEQIQCEVRKHIGHVSSPC